MVSKPMDVQEDGLMLLLTGLTNTDLKVKVNIHIMLEITLVEITQVDSELVVLFKFPLTKDNSKLLLKENQSQFVLMLPTGINMEEVSSTIVEETSIMQSYSPDIKMANIGTLKTHGVDGEKLVISD